MTDRRRFWIRSIPSPGGVIASDWYMTPLVKDFPGFMGSLSVYHSTLKPGHMPHEIHDHPQEEIEVLLSGELDVITPDRTTRIGPGSLFHHPPARPHTIRAVGAEPAVVILFRWSCAEPDLRAASNDSFIFDARRLSPWKQRHGTQWQSIHEGLRLANGSSVRIRANRVSENARGGVHADTYDALIVLLEGHLLGMGYDTTGPAVIYYPAGVLHSFASTSSEPWRTYLFEFHKPPAIPNVAGGDISAGISRGDR